MHTSADTDRLQRAEAAARAHPDVADAAVFDLGPQGGAGPAVLVLPAELCDGADLRDALVAAVGLEPTPPVLVVAADAEDFEAVRADPTVLAALLAESPYVYRWVPPATAAQSAVAEVIADVLGRGAVSMSDNFLDLGGDSLKAVEAVSELEQRTGSMLQIEALFEARTLADLAELAAAGSVR